MLTTLKTKFSDCVNGVPDYVREKDMFGHTITFNFDRKGDTHNTIIGGFFSLIIKLFLYFYIALCFERLIF